MPSNLKFTIGLHLDSEQLEKKLSVIKNEIDNTFTIRGKMTEEINKATQSARVLEKALEKATTTKGISYAAFNAELKKAGMTAGQLTTTLALGGEKFRASLSAANAALALSNRQVVTLNKHIQEVARVTMQTFKYTASNMLFHEMVSQAQQAVRWVTDLNDAVNDIAIVTGKTGDQITRVTEQAIKGSRELRVAARDYAEGALIFYQQGLNDEEVKRRNEVTIKAAKAAGQSVDQMSQQLTAIWNTYGMVADQQERAASIGAKMAAQTAVDFKDIAEAMQIAASPASQMGVSFESLAAIIATVGDTTRQSASIIGNAYKTIFSRMQQLKIDGTDGEVTFKAMSQQLSAMGIALEDNAGNLLSLDKVIDQVGQKWDTWTNKQQLAVAELVGGTRQYGQFLALMQNYDKYLTNLRTAQAEGVETLNQQYTQALDSIESRAENASEAWHRAWSKTFDVDNIKDFYSVSEGLADVFGTLVKTIGGLPGLLGIVALIMRQRILPTGLQIKTFVKDTFNSMTHEGRVKSIQSDYASQRAALSSEIELRENRIDLLANADTTKTKVRNNFKIARLQESINDLKYQQQMAEFDEQIALKNEQINTELAKATGERRAQLELAQAQLTTDREIYEQNLKNIYSKESFGLKTAKKAILTATESPESDTEIASAKRIRSLLGLSEYTTGLLQEMGRGTKGFTADQVRSSLAWKINKILNGDNGVDNPLRGALNSVKKDLKNKDVDFEEAIADLVAKINSNLGRDVPDAVADAGEKVCQALEKFAGDAVAAAKIADKTNPDNPLNEVPEAGDDGNAGDEGDEGENAAKSGSKLQDAVNAVVAGYTNLQMASNAIDTLSDSSATAIDKIGSLTGAMGSFGATLAMVPGTLGWITAGLTTLLPLLLKAVDYVTHGREREIEKINNQIELIETETDKYKRAKETAEKAEKGSKEFNLALIAMSDSVETLQKELRSNKEVFDKVFGHGFNLNALASYVNSQSNQATMLEAEGKAETATSEQNALQRFLTNNGFTGNIKDLNGSSTQDVMDQLKAAGFDSSSYSDERLKTLAETIMQVNASAEITSATLEEMAAELNPFANVQNLSEIDAIKQDLPTSDNEPINADYAQALLTLSEQYENAKQEADSFQKALMAGKDGLTEAEKATLDLAEANLRAAISIGEASKAFGLNAKSVDAQAKQIAKQYNLSAEAAATMAIQDQRLNKGLTTLVKSWGDWKSVLTSAAKYSQDYNDVAVEMTDVIGNLINAVEGFELPETFDLVENMELIEAAATGDEQALLNLGEAVTIAQIKAAELDTTLLNGLADEEWTNRWFNIKENAIAAIEGIRAAAAGLNIGEELNLEDSNYIEDLNEFAMATGMTADEMNHMLSQIGVKANVVTEYVPQTVQVPEYTEVKTQGEPYTETRQFISDDGRIRSEDIVVGHSWKTWTYQSGTREVEGVVPVAQISTGENADRPNVQYIGKKGGGSSPRASGAGGGSGGGGGGGGGGKGAEFKPKNAKSQANSNKLGERYTNIQSRIDRVSRSIQRLSDAEADAWGSRAYRNIQGINTLLGKQAEHLQLLQAEATGYLITKDKPALDKLLAEHGIIGAEYNNENFVQNRQTIIDALEEQRYLLASEVDRLNQLYDANQVVDEVLDQQITEATEKMDEWNDYAKEVISAMDQVDETAQKVQDTMNERMQQIREWMSNQIKQAQIKLDLKLAINDTEIRQLEHLIELWGDLGTEIGKTWKNMRDAANFTAGNAWAYVENANKMRNLLDIASPTGEYRLQYSALFGQDAWDKYLQGHGGHPQEVIDQLQTAIESAQAAMWEAQKKFREMLQEWIKLFQMYMDKFDKISGRIAQSNATLDMFVSILNATGRNYTAAGARSAANIAAARYSNAKGNVQVQRGRYQLAKNAYNIAAGEMSTFQGQYGSDVTAYTEAELIRYQELKNDIDETQKVMDEALTAIKNGISDMASAMTEALESSSEAIARAMFDSIGGAFADNQQALDLYGTRKEVDDYFLDKITKDYELSKLSGQITAYLEDNDITNVERYQDLLKEINEAAQEGVEINQTDLEILQKKFELEQAVDAYEEQQKFKNTMRLSRDASGNWSYVYSGEQNSAAAQQELEQRIKDNTYEIARLQKEAAEAAEEAWIQTWSKIYELEQERASARYQSDEQYRAYIDNMLVLEETKLERYKDEIVKRYDAIDEKFEDSTLAWVMNTDGSLTEMQNLHDYHLDYLHQFGQDVEANADEILTDFYEDVNQVSAGIDDIKGDYTDLEDLINDTTEDMIDSNQSLSLEINKMVNEGTSALRALASEMRESANNMIADLNELERQIDELLAKLQELRQQALEDIDMAEQGYNPSIDIQGTVQNIGATLRANNPNLTDDEILEMAMQEAKAKGYLTQLVNKMSDQALADLGHSTVEGASFAGKERAEELLQEAILRGIAGQIAKTTDEEQATLTRLAQLHQSAGGNYFSKPGLTTIAENGPEIVLNPDDTQNILAAVRMVRATVNSGLASSTSMGLSIASRNASIGGGLAGLGMTVQTPVQQAVQIDANFPNVNVANEVENALDMLILQATQYAGVRQ